MIRLFYDPHSLTWAQAGADGKTHKDHESAMAAGHYMLSGDFFENYQKFDSFFKILEDPNHFRRYKKLVIDRDDFVQPSCEGSVGRDFQRYDRSGRRTRDSVGFLAGMSSKGPFRSRSVVSQRRGPASLIACVADKLFVIVGDGERRAQLPEDSQRSSH